MEPWVIVAVGHFLRTCVGLKVRSGFRVDRNNTQGHGATASCIAVVRFLAHLRWAEGALEGPGFRDSYDSQLRGAGMAVGTACSRGAAAPRPVQWCEG